MADMLQEALEELAAQQKAHQSRTITYRRGSLYVEIDVTPGKSILRTANDQTTLVERPVATFVFTAADLDFGDGVVEPDANDLVDMEMSEDGIRKRFRVLPMGGDPAWRYCDPYQISVEVRTKQVSQSDLTVMTITGTLPDWTAGKAGYSRRITSSGGVDGGTFTADDLPIGLTISSGGTVSGTPLVAGTYTPRIEVVDDVGDSGERNYSVTINAAITLTPTTLTDGTQGVAYSQQITGSGGTGALVFTSTSLPAGLTLSSSGLLSGTPTAAGDYSFTVTATDTVSATGQRLYSLHVA
jgi:hypothetical protein